MTIPTIPVPFPEPTVAAPTAAEHAQATLVALVMDMRDARRKYLSTEDQAIYLAGRWTLERKTGDR